MRLGRRNLKKAMKAMEAAGEDKEAREKANKEYHKVYEQRSEFMKEEMTGFVWLYLRK